MEDVVCQVDDGLDHGEHEQNFQRRAERGIAGGAVGVILGPVAHADRADHGEDQQHAECILERGAAQAHRVEQRRVNPDQEEAGEKRDKAAEVDDAPCPGEGLLMTAGADLFADQHGRRGGKAGEEADDHALQRPEDGGRGDGVLDLMAEHNVDHHIADTDHHFIGDDRRTFPEILGEKLAIPVPVPRDFQHIGFLLPDAQRGDNQHIHGVGDDGSDGGALDAERRETQLAEDENVVADEIRDHRGNTAGKRNFDPLGGAQQRGHGGGEDHQRIGEAHDTQVPDPDLLNGGTVCVDAHDKIWRAEGERAENSRRDRHKGQHDAVGAQNALVVSGAPVLGEEEHAAADKAPESGEQETGELGAETDRTDGILPDCAEHHGIYHASGGRQDILQRHGQRDGHHHGEKLPV